jgi:hypothetical protein
VNEIPRTQNTDSAAAAAAAADKARARQTGDAAAAASANAPGAGQPKDRSVDAHPVPAGDRTGKTSTSASVDRYLASFMPSPQQDRSSAAEPKHAEMSSAKAPTSFPGDTEKTVDTGRAAETGKAIDAGKTAATGGKAAAPASFDQHPVSSQASPPVDHRADHAAQASSPDAPTSFPGDTDQPQSDADRFINSPEQRSAQAGGSAMLDALGVIPVVGTATGVLSAGYDLIHAATDSDRAGKHLEEAALDAMGAIPIVGQVLSAEALVWDVSAGQQRQSGVSNADAPTFSEAWVKGVDGYISDIVNPQSFNPRPPNQTGQ